MVQNAPQPFSVKRGLACFLAGASGASLGSFFHLLFFPDVLGFSLAGVKVLLLYSANVPLALLASGGALLLCRWGSACAVKTSFWLGLAVALGPCFGDWISLAVAWRYWVPALTLLGAGMAFYLGRWAAPSARWNGAVTFASLAIFLVLGFWMPALPPETSGTSDSHQALPLRTDPSPSGPDLVLISVDTLRADAILDDRVPTPNLDRLRSESRWADFGLAPAPATLPSHATMMTGAGVLVHGARKNTKKMPDHLPVLAEILNKAGYRTVGLSSTSVLSRATAFHRGFEVYQNLATFNKNLAKAKKIKWRAARGTWFGWLLPRAYEELLLRKILMLRLEEGGGSARGAQTRDAAGKYLDALANEERPYFFFLHFMDPHQPYAADPSTSGMLTEGLKFPEAYQGQDPGSLGMARLLQSGIDLAHPEAFEAIPYLHQLYLEEVIFMDRCIGTVMQKIEAGGRPTVVLFTSDHGEHFGEHGLMLHNNSVYETLLRVPFVLRAPDLKPGKWAQPPTLEDVAPTLLAYAGVPIPDFMKGRDLRKFEGTSADWVYLGASLKELAYYQNGFKLILEYDQLGVEGLFLTPRGLFRPEQDPEEQHDLSASRPEILEAMLKQATALAEQAEIGQDAALSLDQQRDLEQLGYVDDEE
ncbi:MAG: hypothetical protein DWQ01_00300 [Planctomycetota bacterium]|nr:MAG: hypothetical protein DWQ01_00300 [Planctomycetota bacterium]